MLNAHNPFYEGFLLEDELAVSTVYLWNNEGEMRISHVHILHPKEMDDLKLLSALRNSIYDWLKSDGGKRYAQMLAPSLPNWGDAFDYIPREIWNENGLEVVTFPAYGRYKPGFNLSIMSDETFEAEEEDDGIEAAA